MCECLDYSDGSRYQCLVCADLSREEHDRIVNAQDLVTQQAEDEGLWFRATSASEAYLQQELRRLHAMIEGEEWPLRAGPQPLPF